MITLTLSEIAAAVDGTVIGNPERMICGVSTDSRKTLPEELFVALRGERFDGHDFIPSLRGKCSAVLTEEAVEGVDGVLVSDTLKALGALAAYWKRNVNPKITVGVTGSVGKTTTKELIASVLKEKYRTHFTGGNFNNHIGVPITLIRIEKDSEAVVCEMGMSAKGEIEYLTQLVRPNLAVITNIGTSHLASLGTRENICRAKMEIRLGMKDDGMLLLNADEPLLLEQYELLNKKPKLMSVHNRCGDFRAVNIRQKIDGSVYDLIYESKAVTNVELPVLGKHNVYNSLAAYAVGVMLGMTDEQIRRGLKSFVGADRRQKIYDVGGITVIDDCYNASPESMRAAIDVLTSMAAKKNTRPAALLGDMLELGEYSRLMHDQLGQYAAQMQVQKLFCYGMMADIVAEAAIKKGIRADNVFVCLDTRDAQGMADMILQALEPGDILLVKASRGIAAERIIECMKKRKTKRKKH